MLSDDPLCAAQRRKIPDTCIVGEVDALPEGAIQKLQGFAKKTIGRDPGLRAAAGVGFGKIVIKHLLERIKAGSMYVYTIQFRVFWKSAHPSAHHMHFMSLRSPMLRQGRPAVSAWMDERMIPGSNEQNSLSDVR